MRWASKGRLIDATGCSSYRIRYYHDGCVTEETKRKLHLEQTSKSATNKARTNKNNNASASHASGNSTASDTKPSAATKEQPKLRPKVISN